MTETLPSQCLGVAAAAAAAAAAAGVAAAFLRGSSGRDLILEGKSGNSFVTFAPPFNHWGVWHGISKEGAAHRA
jgi:hypothetical protein